jgi:hypothetical protein
MSLYECSALASYTKNMDKTLIEQKTWLGRWLSVNSTTVKVASAVALLMLLAWALPQALMAFNETGRCLSRLSKLSESEMKLRVVKSLVSKYIKGEESLRDLRRGEKLMLLERSLTEQEIIQSIQSETLMDFLNERSFVLRNEDQLDQFSSKIDSGEFSLIYYMPQLDYVKFIPGKALYRFNPTDAAEFFRKNKALLRNTNEYKTVGNYLYGHRLYQVDTKCCDEEKKYTSEYDKVKSKNRNLKNVDYVNKNIGQTFFIVSNCGAIWVDADDRYSFHSK